MNEIDTRMNIEVFSSILMFVIELIEFINYILILLAYELRDSHESFISTYIYAVISHFVSLFNSIIIS